MIFDTNALTALAEKDPILIQLLRDAREVTTTLISLGEYKSGITNSRKKTELEEWLGAFLERAQVLCPDMETLSHHAAVRTELRTAGTPIPANDCWIAALVRQYGMPIVSRDGHFDLVEHVRRISW